MNVNQDNDILKLEINKTAKSKSLTPYFRRKRMSNVQVNSSAKETQTFQAGSENRIEYFDGLRAFATIAVIMLHVCAANWYTWPVTVSSWITCSFYDSVVRWCVPCFIMISGALFLDKKINLKRLYSKNIFRIVVAFIFWSAIYTFVPSLINNGENKLLTFLEGHYHMWFLFTIIGLYIISPIISGVKGNINALRYTIVFMFISAILIPNAVAILGLFMPNFSVTLGQYLGKFGGGGSEFFNVRFIFYFVLGYYLNSINLSRKMIILIYIFGILGFITTIVCTIYYSIRTNTPNDFFYAYLSINVLLESIAVFVFLKYNFNLKNFGKTARTIIIFISKYSFGIYLVHPLFIEQAKYHFNFTMLPFSSVIGIPILTVLYLTLSVVAAYILSKLPGIGKLIV